MTECLVNLSASFSPDVRYNLCFWNRPLIRVHSYMRMDRERKKETITARSFQPRVFASHPVTASSACTLLMVFFLLLFHRWGNQQRRSRFQNATDAKTTASLPLWKGTKGTAGIHGNCLYRSGRLSHSYHSAPFTCDDVLFGWFLINLCTCMYSLFPAITRHHQRSCCSTFSAAVYSEE